MLAIVVPAWWRRRSPFRVVFTLCVIAACGGDDDLEQLQNVDHIPDGALLDRRAPNRDAGSGDVVVDPSDAGSD
jgi:hypothetical protein